MSPVPPPFENDMKASEEIRSILDRCKSGELAHQQDMYFCGTARCIAGWKVHFDYCKEMDVQDPTTMALIDFAEEHTADVDGFKNNAWGYAQKTWGLTYKQAERLFEWHRTFPEQYRVVEELEAQGK